MYPQSHVSLPVFNRGLPFIFLGIVELQVSTTWSCVPGEIPRNQSSFSMWDNVWIPRLVWDDYIKWISKSIDLIWLSSSSAKPAQSCQRHAGPQQLETGVGNQKLFRCSPSTPCLTCYLSSPTEALSPHKWGWGIAGGLFTFYWTNKSELGIRLSESKMMNVPTLALLRK